MASPQQLVRAVPRAERPVWTIHDLAAEWGYCVRTIRRALKHRPHTVPPTLPTMSRSARWSRDVVMQFIATARNNRKFV
jgi:hypothetical protein